MILKERKKIKTSHSTWSDIPIFIVYLIFLCALIYICVHSILFGANKRLLYPINSHGALCGSRSQPFLVNYYSREDKKYLLYMGLHPMKSRSICIKECPSVNIENIIQFQHYVAYTGNVLCEPNILLNFTSNLPSNNWFNNAHYYTQNGPCPFLPVLYSIPINRICIPIMQNGNHVTQHVLSQAFDFEHAFNSTSKAIKLKILAFFRAFSTDLLANQTSSFVIPLVLFVIFYLLIYSSLYGNAQSFILWFMLVLGLFTTYALILFGVWAMICHHLYMIQAKELGTNTKLNLFNYAGLLAFAFFAMLLCLLATMAFAVNNTKQRIIRGTLYDLIGQCKIYFGALHHVWFLTLFGAMLQFYIFYALVVYVPSNLVTSDIPHVDPVSGYLRFRFQYPALYSLSWCYTLFMGCIFLPLLNLNWLSFIVAHFIAEFYFDRSDIRRRISLRSMLSFAIVATRHSGSLVILTCLEILFWLPKFIYSSLITRYRPNYKSALINIIDGQRRLHNESHLPYSEKSNDSKFLTPILNALQWKYFLRYPLTIPLVLVGLEKYNYCKAIKKTHAIILSCPFPIDTLCSTLQTVFWLCKIGPICLASCTALILLQLNQDSMLYSITTIVIAFVFTNYAITAVLLPLEVTVYTVLFCFCEDTRIITHSFYMPPEQLNDLNVPSTLIDENVEPSGFHILKNQEQRVYHTGVDLMETIKRISPYFGSIGYIRDQAHYGKA